MALVRAALPRARRAALARETAGVTIADDALFGPHVASLRLEAGSVSISDASFALESFPLYTLELSSENLGASLAGPLRNGIPVALGVSLFDVSGTAFRVDAGRVAIAGEYFGLPVAEALDLGLLPFTALLPPGSLAQARWSGLGGGAGGVELRVPFTAALTLSLDGTDSTLTFAGTLVANGTLEQVPEPAAGSLLADGLAGIAFARRRRRSKLSRCPHPLRVSLVSLSSSLRCC